MRIWSFHPRYLDAQGLVALWREALLAQKVLEGATRGYRHHPQLERFKRQIDPAATLAAYLVAVEAEARRRGYRFNAAKIGQRRAGASLQVTQGQLAYEWQLFKYKVAARDPAVLARIQDILEPEPHPLFKITEGPIESWERVRTAA